MSEITSTPSSEYGQWLKSLKEQIRTARIKASLAVNSELVRLYWNIGQQIVQQRAAQSWGAKVIDQLAKDLKTEFPDMSGLSNRNLKYMAQFAEAWPDFLIGHQLGAQIPWKHNCLIIEKIPETQVREWYIKKTIENGWSRSVLEMHIETSAHLRLGAAQNNFADTLPAPQSDLAREVIKDSYVFDFLGLTEGHNERALENALIHQLKDFLIELGVGFAFVGSQYKLDVEGDEFFIDLLFYHTKLHCYVVIELKNTDFKPEHTGQLNFYLAAIDDMVRDPARDEPTIGLLLCRSKKKTVVEYSLRKTNAPMGVSTYRTSPALPKEVANLLPSIEALEARIKIEEDDDADAAL